MDKQAETAGRNIFVYYLIIVAIMAVIVAYWVGNNNGKQSERVKQQLKTNAKQIDSLQGAKTIDAVNTSEKSKKSVIKATMIIRGHHVAPPRIKDTTNEYKKQYIKNFKV